MQRHSITVLSSLPQEVQQQEPCLPLPRTPNLLFHLKSFEKTLFAQANLSLQEAEPAGTLPGRWVGGWRGDGLHGVAGRHLGVAVVALAVAQAGLAVARRT